MLDFVHTRGARTVMDGSYECGNIFKPALCLSLYISIRKVLHEAGQVKLFSSCFCEVSESNTLDATGDGKADPLGHLKYRIVRR